MHCFDMPLLMIELNDMKILRYRNIKQNKGSLNKFVSSYHQYSHEYNSKSYKQHPRKAKYD